jgi:hypothetical protein
VPVAPFGRGGGIRTHGLFVPNEARYQAAPHPEGLAESSRERADRPHPVRRSSDRATACQHPVDRSELGGNQLRDLRSI